MKRRTLLLTVAALVALSCAAQAHWNEGDSCKWIQLPTSTPPGSTSTRPRGSLSQTTSSARRPASSRTIHIWGSWENDYLPFGDDPTGVLFTLSIHADIPASQIGHRLQHAGPAPLADDRRPDVLHRARLGGRPAGRLDRPAGRLRPAGRHGLLAVQLPVHRGHWRSCSRARRSEPIVYWLDVQARRTTRALASDGRRRSTTGTTTRLGYGVEPFVGRGIELIYPLGHRWWASRSTSRSSSVTRTGRGLGRRARATYPDAHREQRRPPHDRAGPADGSAHRRRPERHSLTRTRWATTTTAPTTRTACPSDCDDLQGEPAAATIDMTSATMGGFVDAWIDFGDDGSWDEPGETRSSPSQWVPPGVHHGRLHFPVPAWRVAGTDVRPVPAEHAPGGSGPTGYAPDGEVEDHEVIIEEQTDGSGCRARTSAATGIDVNAYRALHPRRRLPVHRAGTADEITIWGSWLDDFCRSRPTRRRRSSRSASTPTSRRTRARRATACPGSVLWVQGLRTGRLRRRHLGRPRSRRAGWTRRTRGTYPATLDVLEVHVPHPAGGGVPPGRHAGLPSSTGSTCRPTWTTSRMPGSAGRRRSTTGTTTRSGETGTSRTRATGGSSIYPPEHGYIGRVDRPGVRDQEHYGTDVPRTRSRSLGSALRNVAEPVQPEDDARVRGAGGRRTRHDRDLRRTRTTRLHARRRGPAGRPADRRRGTDATRTGTRWQAASTLRSSGRPE